MDQIDGAPIPDRRAEDTVSSDFRLVETAEAGDKFVSSKVHLLKEQEEMNQGCIKGMFEMTETKL